VNEKLKKKLEALPKTPGVYFHKDSSGEIIYIGKAANLRNRVRQYFQKSRMRDPKTDLLVAEIADTDWTELETEADALFLEAELVRRYLPRYNILLRDDKSQIYVRISYKSDYPTVTITRRPLDDGAEYFGPYSSPYAVRKALRYLRKAFPYAVSKPLNQKRTSLYYHLGLDPGLEEGRTSLEAYRANLKKLMQYLRGERVALVREIERDMKKAAKDKDFEAAAKLRNRLFALQALSRQSLFGDREIQDASRDQALVDLAELLCLYDVPRVTEKTPGSEVAGLDAVQERSEERSTAYKGVRQASTGTSAAAMRQEQQQSTGSASTQAVVPRKLRRMECFDISHMQGTDTVASMVVFVNGLPDKANYRKFKMRIPGNDDFAHMHEALCRRLREENRKKWGLPDLIVIDGGKGQLAAAIKARDEAGLTSIPMIGLAKREEEIVIHKTMSLQGVNADIVAEYSIKNKAYIKESEDFLNIDLPANSIVVKLLQRIRDESHRFAVSYHSTLKLKRQTASLLDDIPGIGPTTRKKLIRHFGSARGVINAESSEVQNLLGPKKGSQIAKYLAAYK
jgi:excinuclease ABC subunit C